METEIAINRWVFSAYRYFSIYEKYERNPRKNEKKKKKKKRSSFRSRTTSKEQSACAKLRACPYNSGIDQRTRMYIK